MNLDQKPVTNEFFDFQEKISTIVEEQEEIFATHMQAIKVSAELIKRPLKSLLLYNRRTRNC